MAKDYIPRRAYWKLDPEKQAIYTAQAKVRRERYREELRRKMAGELECNHCGAELRDFAEYCGFCEVELGLAPAR